MPVTETLAQLRQTYTAKVAENDQIVSAADRTDGVLELSEDAVRQFQKNLADCNTIRSQIVDLTSQADAIEWSKTVDGTSVAVAAAASTAGGPAVKAPVDGRTIGTRFVESEQWQKHFASGNGRGDMPHPVMFEGVDLASKAVRSAFEQKTIYSGSGGGDVFGGSNHVGLFDRRYGLAGVRIRDLLNAQPTTQSSIDYIRVSGFGNNAAMVAEYSGGSLVSASQSSLSFDEETAIVRMISHFEIAHMNTLADEAALQNVINGALLAGLGLKEDQQLLYGDGTGQNIRGLLSGGWGIQTYTGLSTDTYVDQIRRAITKAWIAEYPATGVVVNPLDWEKIELTKDSQNNYVVATSVALGGVPQVWQTPVAQSPAVSAGTAVVGAFGLGAQLWDRMQSEIRTSESHANLFIQHGVAIMATQRLALTVPRPEAIVDLTFT